MGAPNRVDPRSKSASPLPQSWLHALGWARHPRSPASTNACTCSGTPGAASHVAQSVLAMATKRASTSGPPVNPRSIECCFGFNFRVSEGMADLKDGGSIWACPCHSLAFPLAQIESHPGPSALAVQRVSFKSQASDVASPLSCKVSNHPWGSRSTQRRFSHVTFAWPHPVIRAKPACLQSPTQAGTTFRSERPNPGRPRSVQGRGVQLHREIRGGQVATDEGPFQGVKIDALTVACQSVAAPMTHGEVRGVDVTNADFCPIQCGQIDSLKCACPKGFPIECRGHVVVATFI